MAQKKAHEVAGWLARPDPDIAIILLYGPDRGLVSERAASFAKRTGIPLDDAFSVVRLEADEADQEGRLLDEALTIPMFAARRLLWIRNVGAHKTIADAVKALCADPPADAIVLIEAGELKKGAPLRSTVEGSRHAMALPCYADEGRDLDQLIDETMAEHGLTISLAARIELRRNLGGDRLASRSELQKLALFAGSSGRVEEDDVRQLTGDVAARSLDETIDAALAGNVADFDRQFQRYMLSGGQTFLLLSSMGRQLQGLELMRATLDEGKRSAGEIVGGARPPVFFSRKKLVETSLRKFSPPFLARALGRLQAALLLSRRRPDLATAVVRQALMGIALESSRLNNR